jgi:hypothetical protein
MNPHRSLSLLAFLTCLACPLFAQQATQQTQLHHRFVVSPHHANDNGRIAPTGIPNLNGLQANFTEDYPIIGANSDGTDLWPCLNIYQGIAGSNPDCPTLGNPSIPFPLGAVVLGVPAYTWPLENTPGNGNGIGCDALVNGTGQSGSPYMPCGQIATWYEDDTRDSTDDLLQRVTVTQGNKIIYDSGTIDYGPAGPTVSYPVDVALILDANFGYWPGAETGPNNGNCSPDLNYPLTAPAWPDKTYVLQANKTCVEPVPGPAVFTTSTSLGTPQYTQATGNACTAHGVQSPCYVVNWIKRYEIHQNFSIILE